MTAKFWDKRAHKYDAPVQEHDDDFNRTVNRLKSLLSSSDTILDFACANGEFSLSLAGHVKEIHGTSRIRRKICL